MRFPLACAGAVVAFALAYGNSLQSPLHFDDDHVIARNPHIRTLSAIPSFFTDARIFSVLPQNATYRPLLSTSLAVDVALGGGLSLRTFHLTQLTLFAGVGLLLFLVARALLRTAAGDREEPWHRWAALLSASLFCLHTANTQPGNYISARSELLCALGVLGALLVYLRAPRLRAWGLWLLPMVAGALAKTPAVIAVPLVLAWTLLDPQARRRPLRAALPLVPAFAIAAAVFLFVESMNPAGQTYGGGSRLEYLWTQAGIWLRYAALFVLPTGLSADTDLGLLPSPLSPRVFGGVLLLVGSLVVALRLARRAEWRPAGFGIVWFWLGIAPTSSVFPLAEVTNDHRMFLGYLGLSLAFGTLVAERLHVLGLARPIVRRAGAAVCIALLCAHAVGTHLRNRMWQSEEALWADVVEKSPRNGRGWMNYGLTQLAKGELQRAKALFDHAATLTPDYAVLEVNRGIAEGALGDAAAAEGHFLRALALSPQSAAPPFFYARWLVDQGRAPEALGQLDAAIARDFGDLAPRKLRLWLAAARDVPPGGARALAQELLPLGGGTDAELRAFAEGRHPFGVEDGAAALLADGLAATGRNEHLRAAVSYRMALAKDASLADAWNNLGWALLQLGFAEESVAHFERAAALNGADERPRNNAAEARARIARRELQVATAAAREGRHDEALRSLWGLVVAWPEWAAARAELGMVLAAMGRCSEAQLELARATETLPETAAMRESLERCRRDAPVSAAGR